MLSAKDVHESQCFLWAGDSCCGGTPGPIPNPEVKPTRADGTAGATLWESRASPSHKPYWLFFVCHLGLGHSPAVTASPTYEYARLSVRLRNRDQSASNHLARHRNTPVLSIDIVCFAFNIHFNETIFLLTGVLSNNIHLSTWNVCYLVQAAEITRPKSCFSARSRETMIEHGQPHRARFYPHCDNADISHGPLAHHQVTQKGGCPRHGDALLRLPVLSGGISPPPDVYALAFMRRWCRRQACRRSEPSRCWHQRGCWSP